MASSRRNGSGSRIGMESVNRVEGDHSAEGKRLVVKDDVEERAMNVHGTVVVIDEAQLAEPVHEETDPGTSGADHVGERFLTDPGNDRLGFTFFSKMRHQQ